MSVVEFYRIGDHGADDVPAIKYPWLRWMNGEIWGFDPEFFNSTPTTFRKRLRENARMSGMTVELTEYTIDNVRWVVFSYN